MEEHVQVVTPPAGSWTSPSAPGHHLYPLPLPVFEALLIGDLDLASSLAPPTCPALTEFLIAPSTRGVWGRRLSGIASDTGNIPWMSRLIVWDTDSTPQKDQRTSAATSVIVGRIGFHEKPDERGMVEVGYEIDPIYQRQGHATAAMRIMIELARELKGVNVLRASVAEENLISTRIVKGQGLQRVGFQVDERRGPEVVYELEVRN